MTPEDAMTASMEDDEAGQQETFNDYGQYLQLTYILRGVVPGRTGGAMAPPDFGRSVNPISTKGGRLSPPNNTGTPGFSDLPTALWLLMQEQAVGFFCMKTNGLWQFLLENMHKFCMKKLKVVSLFLSI